jgi:hypothetical protein
MDCPYGGIDPKFNLELCHMPFFRTKILAWVKRSVRNCSPLGWGLDYDLATKPVKNECNGKIRAQGHTEENWDYLPENILNLTRIMEFCKAQSIRVVLVSTPLHHSYYENIDEKQLKKMYSVVDSLKSWYRFDYFDYLKDSRFDTDDFWDSNHLSDVGAEKFTRILNEDMAGE